MQRALDDSDLQWYMIMKGKIEGTCLVYGFRNQDCCNLRGCGCALKSLRRHKDRVVAITHQHFDMKCVIHIVGEVMECLRERYWVLTVRDIDINIATDRPPHKLSGREMMRVGLTQQIEGTHALQRTTPRNIAPILVRSPVSMMSAESMKCT